MILRKAYQFKLKPDGAERRKLAQFCGCARYVYNRGLAWNNDGSVYFFVSGRNLSVGRSDSPPSFWRPVTPQKEGLSSPPRRQAIERVGKHSWNSAGPKGVARGASICREMVLARPERLLTACGVRGMKAEHRPPILPSHAAASAGVTGAAPLSRRRSIGRRW